MKKDPQNVTTIQDLAAVMFREFARINDQFLDVNSQLSEIRGGQDRIEKKVNINTADISSLKEKQSIMSSDISLLKEGQSRLEKKIDNDIEELALMTKRGFDEMTGNFNEVREELDQIKNHVIGIDRRVTKLEKAEAQNLS